MNRNHQRLLTLAVSVTALSALAGSGAFAQSSRSTATEKYSVGMMQGSTIRDRVRDRDRDRRNDPVPGWTGGVGFIPGSGRYYDGCSPVIIVNNSPCYVPGYYTGMDGYGYGYNNGSYSTGGFNANLQIGGFNLGYRQNNGYYRSNGYYNAYPTPVQQGGTYVRETVREYVAPVDPGVYSRGVDRGAVDRGTYDVRVRPETTEDRSTPPSVVPSKPSGDDNDYYLHRKPSPLAKNPGLTEAVRDIETAFRTGNLSSLERHIDAAGKLVLQVKGTTRREMTAQDYLAMTQDALKVMKTAKYELSKVEPASNGAMMVTGTHTLKTEDGQQKSFIVGFILKPKGENWLITEVSAEPTR